MTFDVSILPTSAVVHQAICFVEKSSQLYNPPLYFIAQSQMDNTRGLIAGVRKELMCEDVEEQFKKKNRNDTDQITERALEAEDKFNNAKGTNLTASPLLKES